MRISRGWSVDRAITEPVRLGRTLDLKHGTMGMYNSRKCRCAQCRECNASYRREHNRRKKVRT